MAITIYNVRARTYFYYNIYNTHLLSVLNPGIILQGEEHPSFNFIRPSQIQLLQKNVCLLKKTILVTILLSFIVITDEHFTRRITQLHNQIVFNKVH